MKNKCEYVEVWRRWMSVVRLLILIGSWFIATLTPILFKCCCTSDVSFPTDAKNWILTCWGSTQGKEGVNTILPSTCSTTKIIQLLGSTQGKEGVNTILPSTCSTTKIIQWWRRHPFRKRPSMWHRTKPTATASDATESIWWPVTYFRYNSGSGLVASKVVTEADPFNLGAWPLVLYDSTQCCRQVALTEAQRMDPDRASIDHFLQLILPKSCCK